MAVDIHFTSLIHDDDDSNQKFQICIFLLVQKYSFMSDYVVFSNFGRLCLRKGKHMCVCDT